MKNTRQATSLWKTEDDEDDDDYTAVKEKEREPAFLEWRCTTAARIYRQCCHFL